MELPLTPEELDALYRAVADEVTVLLDDARAGEGELDAAA